MPSVAASTANLFALANLDQLLVVAAVSGEDLPSLEALDAGDRRWTIQAIERTVGEGTAAEGKIDDIGSHIDPDLHTAVVTGRIDNKGLGLRAGQSITATVTLPTPVTEVSLPSSALVEEGERTFVFVRAAGKKLVYEQRRVLVVRRGKDCVHVRFRLTPEQERLGFETVRPGEEIVAAGVLELQAILEDSKTTRTGK